MQPAFQFPVSSQLDEHHLVEGEAHKVKRLRDRSRSSIVDIRHDLLRDAVGASGVVVLFAMLLCCGLNLSLEVLAHGPSRGLASIRQPSSPDDDAMWGADTYCME